MTMKEIFTQIIQLVLVVGADGLESEGFKTAQLRQTTCPCRNMGGGHE